MLIIHNETVGSMMHDGYLLRDVDNLFAILQRNGTFTFQSLVNGLFPAAHLKQDSQYTGYSNVWVRDNIYIAYAHYINNHVSVSLQTIRTLARYFITHKWRFEQIIAGAIDYNEPMNRPNIRFDGNELSEINQKWAHAQNDALGYFVWLICTMYYQDHIIPTSEEKELLALFVLYFHSIHYWKDEDSGHWEEARKIESSSIGVVVGALQALKTLLQGENSDGYVCSEGVITNDLLDTLISQGRHSLQLILPFECSQSDPKKYRPHDAALIFLIFPMNIIDEEMTEQILSDVIDNLQGDYGIRRYTGDSFWSPDYKIKLSAEERTVDFSDDIASRDRLVQPGQEAQWCIFDPIISIIYGLKYQQFRQEKYLQAQTHYFNRSLGQLTEENSLFGGFKCPELYYLEEGRYVPNDTVPLLWTQANLWMAFRFMRDSLLLK
jgi:hypothetical protein